MINVMLTGVGGQGTVLAAKVLAQAALSKGWQVRTAETIGMAQRGGSVISHVRMGNEGEEVHAPLLAKASAQLIIAFEPSEAARVLPYLAPGGVLVTARTTIQPVTAALAKEPYVADAVISRIEALLEGTGSRLVVVDDEKLIAQVGNRKALNTVLLGSALAAGCLPLSVEEMKDALSACVKPRFVEMNLAALDAALA
ncbi:MAG: indolepyruvate oxidoreductase subunit beta [Eggerthellaceae bacterium]|nr:indolepyruvate oxidoreductase subunit beta [Eggerthellaceae bacterium]